MKTFTYFPKKERISWIIIALLGVLGIILPKYLFPEKKINPSISFSKTGIDSAILFGNSEKNSPEFIPPTKQQTKNQQENPEWNKRATFEIKKEKRNHNFFPFDPNTSPDDSIKLLLPGYAAQNLIKYRNSGGYFKDKKSLLRIYGMDSVLFRKIEPYIRIHPKGNKHTVDSRDLAKKNAKPVKKTGTIALNDADTSALKTLPGIGSVFAGRIIAFRDALGGFCTVDQVAETYGLPAETFGNIRERLTRGSPQRKIRVNSASQKELAAHPYISWKQARAICLYREAHGPFADIGKLHEIRALDSALVRKVTPYLDFSRIEVMPEEPFNSSPGGR